jgi:HD-like signal output (HDOD) protein/DNA-binding CsgD family transcriptional regulator
MSASLTQPPRTTRNATPTPKDQQRPQAPTQRHTHSSHGKRLARAFTDVELLPALSEARERVLAITDGPSVATGELIAAVESDAALTLAVMRTANDDLPTAARLDTVLGAIEQIGTRGVRSLALETKPFDFFERGDGWDLAPQTFRLHGLATQRAADRIAAEIFHPHRDRLALSSLLHDIGKLVLIRAYPGYPEQVHRTAQLPEERIHSERRELGVDHALVGGVLLRRWGLPTSIAGAVERHHDPAADGEAAVVRVADMLAHYQHGDSISPVEMLAGARTIGLDPQQVRRLICDLSSDPGQVRHLVDPCPLSARELRVLQRLADGSVYKEIALDLNLSASTVRSHLNKIYRKLGARDRAQAVLIASRRGWL